MFVRVHVRRQQPRDPEVEQHRVTIAGHHDVRRFDVAVHDELTMGVLERFADAREEREALVDGEPLFVAVAIDRAAVDVLHHEIRAAIRGAAAVEQSGDVWMTERRQDAAFAIEPPVDFFETSGAFHELQRAALLELDADPLDEMDRAHAAAADLANHAPAADALADLGFSIDLAAVALPAGRRGASGRRAADALHRGLFEGVGRAVQIEAGQRRARQAEQLGDFVTQRVVRAAAGVEEFALRGHREVHRRFEECVHSLTAGGVHACSVSG